ncbi:hypothetical protein HanRHA438_Chr09g0380011 [Helianthus annuus]|nr:hypothetical protein HanRHA438_Chr09g0380011 [Helianthus annuus]
MLFDYPLMLKVQRNPKILPTWSQKSEVNSKFVVMVMNMNTLMVSIWDLVIGT